MESDKASARLLQQHLAVHSVQSRADLTVVRNLVALLETPSMTHQRAALVRAGAVRRFLQRCCVAAGLGPREGKPLLDSSIGNVDRRSSLGDIAGQPSTSAAASSARNRGGGGESNPAPLFWNLRVLEHLLRAREGSALALALELDVHLPTTSGEVESKRHVLTDAGGGDERRVANAQQTLAALFRQITRRFPDHPGIQLHAWQCVGNLALFFPSGTTNTPFLEAFTALSQAVQKHHRQDVDVMEACCCAWSRVFRGGQRVFEFLDNSELAQQDQDHQTNGQRINEQLIDEKTGEASHSRQQVRRANAGQELRLQLTSATEYFQPLRVGPATAKAGVHYWAALALRQWDRHGTNDTDQRSS